MSDLIPTLTPLAKGLDLKTPALLVEPGSLLSCLNYEVAESQGYKRVDGFVPYDGMPTLKDFEGGKYWSRAIIQSGTWPALPLGSQFIWDDNGDIIGWCFSVTQETEDDPVIMRFISFLGDPNLSGTLATDAVVFAANASATITEIAITLDEMNAMETAVRGLVAANAEESIAVGLHWHRDHLYGVFPLVCIRYESSAALTVFPGSALTMTIADPMSLIVLDKIVVTAPGPGDEEGYIICLQTSQGEYEADADDTYTLSGGVVSGDAGTIYHQMNSLASMSSFAAHLWKATRQNPYVSTTFNGGGWQPLSFTYSVRSDISLFETDYLLQAIKRGYKPDEATLLRINAEFEVILEDFYVVSGDLYEAEAARVILQVSPATETLVPITELGTEETVEIWDTVTEAWVEIGATVSYPRLVFLAGASEGVAEIAYYDTVDTVLAEVEENSLRGLSFSPSRYTWKSANFFATEASDAFYGCNGAGRGFACTPYTLPDTAFAGTYSWIYTQPDEDKDRPRHVENHNQHLMLGFGPGSAMTSVVGLPTNYQGVEGAAEIGVGDRVTGLLVLNGTTTAIFCESSIWCLQGQTIDNFNTQIISPNVGAVEYTVANCGQPVFLNQYGISTLEQTAAYGDFSSSAVSQIVAPWLVPRCKLPYPNADFYEGIVGAFPVRKKNQYRVFFNDGEVLTATFTPEGVLYTRQIYQIPVADQVDNKLQRMTPIAWTSQVDSTGRERIMVSHYDKRVQEVPVPPPEPDFMPVMVHGGRGYSGEFGSLVEIAAATAPTDIDTNGLPAALSDDGVYFIGGTEVGEFTPYKWDLDAGGYQLMTVVGTEGAGIDYRGGITPDARYAVAMSSSQTELVVWKRNVGNTEYESVATITPSSGSLAGNATFSQDGLRIVAQWYDGISSGGFVTYDFDPGTDTFSNEKFGYGSVAEVMFGPTKDIVYGGIGEFGSPVNGTNVYTYNGSIWERSGRTGTTTGGNQIFARMSSDGNFIYEVDGTYAEVRVFSYEANTVTPLDACVLLDTYTAAYTSNRISINADGTALAIFGGGVSGSARIFTVAGATLTEVQNITQVAGSFYGATLRGGG